MKVYVTGYGVLSSLGNTAKEMFGSLLESRSAVKIMEAWQTIDGLHCHLGAPCAPFDSKVLPRSSRRTMSPMSEMASLATFQALEQAGLRSDNNLNPDLEFNKTLLIMGSTTGSPVALEEYFQKLLKANSLAGQPGTSFFKVMNHSVASNVAVALGFNGAVMAPSSACATSAQSIIMGWELIQSGLYDVAICGGADEIHYLTPAVFDVVYAASRGYNDQPDLTPRPFDKKRDGLVVSEGASVVILESERHAAKRGAKPLAEICGGAYLCESSHMSQSNDLQMVKVMTEALRRSELPKEKVEYINAHATGTMQGDAAEASAIRTMFGSQVPVSTLKAHFGHSMAACGALELIATIKMMEENTLIGTRNLAEVAEECAGVMHLNKNTKQSTDIALSNNFAFGGINTSFIIKKTT